MHSYDTSIWICSCQTIIIIYDINDLTEKVNDMLLDDGFKTVTRCSIEKNLDKNVSGKYNFSIVILYSNCRLKRLSDMENKFETIGVVDWYNKESCQNSSS